MFHKLSIIALSVAICTLSRNARAVNRSWDDGGGTGNWSEGDNWRPNNTSPQQNDDVFIGNLPVSQNDVTAYNVQGPFIGSLTLSNGASVITDGHQLRVEGDTVLSDPGTRIFVEPNDNPLVDALDTDTLTVNDDTIVFVHGGILEVNNGPLTINSGGSLIGRGLVELPSSSGGTPVLKNNGQIRVRPEFSGDAALTIQASGGGTLDAGDLDVDNGESFGALTLTIDGPHEGQFNDTIDIGRDDTVNIVQPWEFAGADINFNGGNGVATLTGAPLTASVGSDPELNVISGTAEIENDLFGSFFVRVADNSTLQFDGTADVNLDFNHANVGLIVNGDTTIAQISFRWAGSDDNSTTIIGPGGALNIDVGILDPTDSITFDAVIHVNSGDLTVIMGAGRWVMQGALNIANTTGQVPALFGDPVEIGNGDSEIAELIVSGNGSSAIHADVFFRSDADVDVAEEATLKLTGAARFSSGSATMLDGKLQLESDEAQIDSGASFTGSGQIVNVHGFQLTLGDAAIVALLLNNKGDLDLENGAVATTTAAAFEQTATGTLHIDLAGTNVSEADRLNVSSVALLDGTLDVSLLGGFNPLLGDEFTILSATGVEGTFATVNPPVLDPGLALGVVYNPTSVVLQIISDALPGDYNEDGTVDAADYVRWRDNLGSDTSLPNDDTAGVAQDDYDRWVANFGGGAGTASSSSLIEGETSDVPEPKNAVLLVLAIAGLYLRCRVVRRLGAPE